MDWSMISKTVLGLVRSAAANPNVQEAGLGLLQGLGSRLIEKADDPAAVRRVGNALTQLAPAVLGAVLKGTPAEKQVDPKIIKAADDVVANAPTPGRSDSAGT